MALKRQWVTPLMAGSFILMATTGILMFFHLDSGLNKTAHEWLGLGDGHRCGFTRRDQLVWL